MTHCTTQPSPCHCLQCHAPVADGQEFCCNGCEAAYATLHNAEAHRPTLSALAQPDQTGSYTLTVAVQGIHCASCIQLIENALYGEPNVTYARVNMTTERLTVTWQGSHEDGDRILQSVTKLGYRILPVDSTDPAAQQAKAQENQLLRCIAVSGFAAGNLMMLSVGLWSSTSETMGIATQTLFHWLSALIALPAVLYTGRPFFSSAWQVLKEGHTNMDVPISLAVILACTMSLLETLSHGEHIYFDSALMLLFFLLIGRYLDARAKGKARSHAQDLLSMLHGTATVLDGGKPVTTPIRELREGMVVLVAAGEHIPADGTLSKGTSDLDMSLITGETLPQSAGAGTAVFAGTLNLAAPVEVTITKASGDSLLSDIVRLMEQAEQGQARYVRLADKAARLYTPVVHTLGLVTFLGWWLGIGIDWQPALLYGITVLIITCPCALGLAVPVVQVLASSRLMQRGILLKSGDALEKLAAITTAIFDKTGTLTLGQPQLLQRESYPAGQLQLAASLAIHSKHPLSQALSHAYEGAMAEVTQVEELPGKGLQGQWQNKTVRLGSRSWCGDAATPSTIPSTPGQLELWLQVEGEPSLRFTFEDKLREDAPEVIHHFQEVGITPHLLSGDRQETVTAIAQATGISHYHASLTPVEKCDKIKILQEEGQHILMVGDGLNDAPSLALADISISPATAMDITQNTADIVFQGDSLQPVWYSWRIARHATQLVKQNFALAVLYNLVAIPLAVLGYVTPMVAAIAMSGSSLLVIGNSFRLKR